MEKITENQARLMYQRHRKYCREIEPICTNNDNIGKCEDCFITTLKTSGFIDCSIMIQENVKIEQEDDGEVG